MLARWKVWALAALLAAAAMVPAAFAEDVKVGVLLPRTGRYAETGISTLRGIEMVLKSVNGPAASRASAARRSPQSSRTTAPMRPRPRWRRAA
jgi:hypothetical protein